MSDRESAPSLSQAARPLAAFAGGESAVISGFLGGPKLQERLVTLGLYLGQRLIICQNNGISLVVKVNGNSLVLSRCISQKILATPTGNGCQQHGVCQCPPGDSKGKI